MSSVEVIKNKIGKLYQIDPHIHITATINKIHLVREPVIIKDVYPHIFRIEQTVDGLPQCYILQYTDILIGHIQIDELGL